MKFIFISEINLVGCHLDEDNKYELLKFLGNKIDGRELKHKYKDCDVTVSSTLHGPEKLEIKYKK